MSYLRDMARRMDEYEHEKKLKNLRRTVTVTLSVIVTDDSDLQDNIEKSLADTPIENELGMAVGYIESAQIKNRKAKS